jgi:hypothetical protein
LPLLWLHQEAEGIVVELTVVRPAMHPTQLNQRHFIRIRPNEQYISSGRSAGAVSS